MATSLRNRKFFLPAIAALMTLAVFLICLSLRSNGFLETLELRSYDLLRRTQRSDKSFASRIVVVGIDEDDIHRPDIGYPILDSALTALLTKIVACEPRAVGVDIYRDIPVPPAKHGESLPGREDLLKLWADNPNIIQVFLLNNDRFGVNGVAVPKPAGLDDSQVGAAEFGVDRADGVARRGLLFEGGSDPTSPGGATTYATLDWRLALWYLNGESPPLGPQPIAGADPKDFYLGHAKLRHFHADDGPYVNGEAGGVSYLLDCKSSGSFRHFSATQILSDNFSPDFLKDAVVIVGMRAKSVKDLISTPVSIDEYGVDVHAAAVDQLLRMAIRGDPQLRFAPGWMYAAWSLLWSIGGALLGYRVRRPVWWIVGIASGVCLIILVAWIGFGRAWWVPIVPPGICWIGAIGLVGIQVSYFERSDRLLLRRLFASTASSRVVDELWDRRDELLNEGRLIPRELEATVMFTDLRGFSKIAERLSPADMIGWINGLMDPMSRLVYRHDGMVKQYAGDAIMALFGVPLPGPDGTAGDARNAVCCALGMRNRLDKINRRSRLRNEPEVEMRIGICTGPLVAGSIGGRDRAEYTVIGDTVNIGSRLESFKKSFRDPDIASKGCRILIDERTRQLLDERFQTRYVEDAPLTGDKLVRIHGVIQGPASNSTIAQADQTPPQSKKRSLK